MMTEQRNENSSGGLVISHDVIASIALNTVKEIKGVSRVAKKPSNIRTLFRVRGDALDYIDVTINNSDIQLHLYLVLTSDAKIPSVSKKVQTKVKDAVQNMTSKMVSQIDIDIIDIDFPDDQKVAFITEE